MRVTENLTAEEYRTILPEARLITQIIQQAIIDAFDRFKDGTMSAERKDALDWINSNSVKPWSFLWCLEQVTNNDRLAGAIRSYLSNPESKPPRGCCKRRSKRFFSLQQLEAPFFPSLHDAQCQELEGQHQHKQESLVSKAPTERFLLRAQG